MLVFASVRIRPKRRDGAPGLALNGAGVPVLWPTVQLRRAPPLDVPAIERQVLRHLPQLDDFADQPPVGVAVFPPAADPGEPRPSPHSAEVGLAVAVRSPGQAQSSLDKR